MDNRRSVSRACSGVTGKKSQSSNFIVGKGDKRGGGTRLRVRCKEGLLNSD